MQLKRFWVSFYYFPVFFFQSLSRSQVGGDVPLGRNDFTVCMLHRVQTYKRTNGRRWLSRRLSSLVGEIERFDHVRRMQDMIFTNNFKILKF